MNIITFFVSVYPDENQHDDLSYTGGNLSLKTQITEALISANIHVISVEVAVPMFFAGSIEVDVNGGDHQLHVITQAADLEQAKLKLLEFTCRVTKSDMADPQTLSVTTISAQLYDELKRLGVKEV